MEEETMNEELVNEEAYDETEERSGMPTGLAMLIGGGIAIGVAAGAKKLKKVWDSLREKRAKDGVVVTTSTDEDTVTMVDSDDVND